MTANELIKLLESRPHQGDYEVVLEFPNMEIREALRQPALDAHWELMGGRFVINCANNRQR